VSQSRLAAVAVSPPHESPQPPNPPDQPGTGLRELSLTQLGALTIVTSLIVMALGALVFPTPLLAPDEPLFLRGLAHWDAGWYAEIAAHGYWYHPGEQSPVAYFPLFPLVLTGLVQVGLNRWLAGVLASLTFGVLGTWLFTRWARALAPRVADDAARLLLVFPFAVYLYGIIYSDGLFLTCVAAAFLFLERDRPLVATLFGVLATACRPVALAVAVGLLVRSVERRHARALPVRAVDLLPVVSLVGIAAWMIFLDVRFHDALAWIHVQGAPGWDQPPGWRSWLKLTWFQTMFPHVAPLVALRLGGHALVTVGAVSMLVPTFRRLGVGYGVYCLMVVGIPAISSKDFQGLGRYVLAAFPLFLTLALMLAEMPYLRRRLLVGSALVMVGCAFAFGAGGYVA
jgi:hypothetical protein